MKICVITGRFPLRSETFVQEHVRGLVKRGHKVYVMSYGPGADIHKSELEVLNELGITRIDHAGFSNKKFTNLLRFFWETFSSPRKFKYLKGSKVWTRGELFVAADRLRLINEIRPDVIHVHFGMVAGPLQEIGNFSNIIVTWHGLDANVIPKKRGEQMYRSLFSTDCCHSVGSDFMVERLAALGARRKTIELIPMGVDLNRFKMRPARFEHEVNCFTIVSVGRLDEMKGHQFLISAVLQLLEEGREIIVKIIGEGPLRHQLTDQIKSSNYMKSIRLLGSLPPEGVRKQLEAADLFALTGTIANDGRVETQGVALIEAQALGIPVVACDIGGVSQSLVDGKTGVLCPSGDIGKISMALKFFMDNPNERHCYGKRGRSFVENQFGIEKMLDSFERVYRQIGTSEGASYEDEKTNRIRSCELSS